MPGVVAFCDVRGALRAWGNGLTDLSGLGKPITNGFHLSARDSPGTGTTVIITRAGGGSQEGGMPIDTPACTFAVEGPDAGSTEAAAIALARALQGLSAAPVTVTTGRGDHVRLHLAGNITLLDSPNGTKPRFIVSADVWGSPA